MVTNYINYLFLIQSPPFCDTSNVTGRHRGQKWKLRAGYIAPSRHPRPTCRLSYFCLLNIIHCNARHIFIVECGVARFLYAMCVFDGPASSSSPGLPLCQISFLSRGPHCWASPWRKIGYSITQSLSPSLFDVPGTEANDGKMTL